MSKDAPAADARSRDSMVPLAVTLAPWRAVALLIGIATAVAFVGAYAEYGDFFVGNEFFDHLAYLFSAAYGRNISIWYHAMVLLLSVLAITIFLPADAPGRGWWLALAVLLLWISIDAIADFWEPFEPLLEWVQDLGVSREHLLVACVIGFALGYVGLIRSLSATAAFVLALASLLHIGGALVTEWQWPVQAWFDHGGQEDSVRLVHGWRYVAETGLKSIGAALVFGVVLMHLRTPR